MEFNTQQLCCFVLMHTDLILTLCFSLWSNFHARRFSVRDIAHFKYYTHSSSFSVQLVETQQEKTTVFIVHYFKIRCLVKARETSSVENLYK